jgi:hypothetical protein
MDHGKILAVGTLEELIQIVGEKDIIIVKGKFSVDQGRNNTALFKEATVLSLKEGQIMLSLEASKKMPLLLEEFFKQGIGIDDIAIKRPNLESVFLKIADHSRKFQQKHIGGGKSGANTPERGKKQRGSLPGRLFPYPQSHHQNPCKDCECQSP